MYIKSEREGLQSICLPGMADSADFSENGIAQVTAEDGRVLLEEYPETFSEHTTNED